MQHDQLFKNASEQLLAQHAKALSFAEQGVDKFLAAMKTTNVRMLGLCRQAPEPFAPSSETLDHLQAAMDTYAKLIQLTSSYMLCASAELAQGMVEKTAEMSDRASDLVKK